MAPASLIVRLVKDPTSDVAQGLGTTKYTAQEEATLSTVKLRISSGSAVSTETSNGSIFLENDEANHHYEGLIHTIHLHNSMRPVSTKIHSEASRTDSHAKISQERLVEKKDGEQGETVTENCGSYIWHQKRGTQEKKDQDHREDNKTEFIDNVEGRVATNTGNSRDAWPDDQHHHPPRSPGGGYELSQPIILRHKDDNEENREAHDQRRSAQGSTPDRLDSAQSVRVDQLGGLWLFGSEFWERPKKVFSSRWKDYLLFFNQKIQEMILTRGKIIKIPKHEGKHFSPSIEERYDKLSIVLHTLLQRLHRVPEGIRGFSEQESWAEVLSMPLVSLGQVFSWASTMVLTSLLWSFVATIVDEILVSPWNFLISSWPPQCWWRWCFWWIWHCALHDCLFWAAFRCCSVHGQDVLDDGHEDNTYTSHCQLAGAIRQALCGDASAKTGYAAIPPAVCHFGKQLWLKSQRCYIHWREHMEAYVNSFVNGDCGFEGSDGDSISDWSEESRDRSCVTADGESSAVAVVSVEEDYHVPSRSAHVSVSPVEKMSRPQEELKRCNPIAKQKYPSLSETIDQENQQLFFTHTNNDDTAPMVNPRRQTHGSHTSGGRVSSTTNPTMPASYVSTQPTDSNRKSCEQEFSSVSNSFCAHDTQNIGFDEHEEQKQPSSCGKTSNQQNVSKTNQVAFRRQTQPSLDDVGASHEPAAQPSMSITRYEPQRRITRNRKRRLPFREQSRHIKKLRRQTEHRKSQTGKRRKLLL